MQDNSMVMLVAIAVIGVISLIVGIVIGNIVSGLRHRQGVASSSRSLQLANGVHVWMEARSESLAVEVDGRRIRIAEALTTQQRAALARLLDAFQFWLGMDEVPVTRIETAGSAPAVDIRATMAASPVEKAALKRADWPKAEPAIRPTSTDLGDIITGVFTADASDEKQLLSIPAQINAVVQEFLPRSPLAGRLINLRDAPNGGIVVWVDDQRYNGVGEVPDALVRKFLQGCVSEWEKRNASGD